MDHSLQPSIASSTSNSPELAPLTGLLDKIIRHGGFELEYEIRPSGRPAEDSDSPEIIVELSGGDSDLLLEKNAQLLNAIEDILLKAARLPEGAAGMVGLDCNDWRRVRAEEIRLTAQMAAQHVIETGQPYTLNPMTPRERRIAHLALKDRPAVRTLSEGAGRDRRVVIFPAEPDSSGAPPR